MTEAPYGEIADLLKAGRVVPFLGAGVNIDTRPAGALWEPTAQFLPSGSELSVFLAGKANFPLVDERDRKDLAKVASYFAEQVARRRLRERLHDVFGQKFAPGAMHKYLADLEVPLLIVTTNYDDLTERAFMDAGRPYDLVVHPTDRADIDASVWYWKHGASEPEAVPPKKLYVDLDNTTVIYKMHGTVHQSLAKYDSYVITEEDYVDFLARMIGQTAVPAIFMRHFQTRHFLFLGYGLNDWNLRVVLRNLQTQHPMMTTGHDDDDEERTSWAIQHLPSDLEVQLWGARRVKIFDTRIDAFVDRLRQATQPLVPATS